MKRDQFVMPLGFSHELLIAPFTYEREIARTA